MVSLKVEKCRKLIGNNYYFLKRIRGLGIPSKYMAYYYLVDIMDILINENRRIRAFSREVYPKVAKKYDKTDCTVERDIRSVIKKFWCTSLKNKLSAFWHKERSPRCCEFIYLVKNYLVQDIA